MKIALTTALALTLGCSALAVSAQTTPARTTPRVQLFGGYSFLYPNATATGTLPGGITPITSCLCAHPAGAGGGMTINLLPWLGVTVDASGSFGSNGSTTAQKIGQWSFYNVAAGPTATLHFGPLAPFLEVLGGDNHLAPALFPPSNHFGLLAGGGLDLPLGHHLGIRLFRADYVYSNHHFGANPNDAATNLRGLRIESGLLVSFGGVPARHPHIPAPVPEQIKGPVVPPAVVITPPVIAAAPEGTTLTIVASPVSVVSGATSTLTATGVSLQNHPLTYSFESNLGTLQQTGNNTAILSTAGLGAGAILVTANAVDTFGGHAAATASVMVTPQIVVPEAARPLGVLGFARDHRRPTRVDNEAKASLDAFALTLQHDSGSRLVLVATAGPSRTSQRDAAQRAVNTEAYLVGEKGIDPARISLYTGPDGTPLSVTATLVPAGAAFDTANLTPVDATHLHAQPRYSLR